MIRAELASPVHQIYSEVEIEKRGNTAIWLGWKKEDQLTSMWITTVNHDSKWASGLGTWGWLSKEKS